MSDVSNQRYLTLQQMMADAAEGVRPPHRTTVPATAAQYRMLNNPGAYTGKWVNETVPYMVEPQEVLTSMDYTAMIFAGPAQAAKTDIFFNWLTHTVINDPADMMLIQTSMTTAKDFARRRVDRFHRHTREAGKRLVNGRAADSMFAKTYLSGMLLTLSWPTINELSGKPVQRLWLTDYDRMTQDVDGEGSPFDLARKRATTFRRHGMTVAESSPGFLVEDPKWAKPYPGSHMAPPTGGILALYNRGDRRLFYWRCPQCENPFEPDFPLLCIPDSDDFVEAGEATVMVCPHCSYPIPHDYDDRYGFKGKYDLNLGGRWVPEGMAWEKNGELSGKRMRSDIASFWLKGVCAAFADWKTLVINYKKALKEYEETGSETALKTTVNTDQGRAYTQKILTEGRTLEALKERVVEDFEPGTVPLGVRFIVFTVDVQKHRFECQAHGIGPGGDIWVLDRFNIRKSKRLDDEGHPWPVSPHAYAEDWEMLYQECMQKTYPLADDTGRQMKVKLTASDSAGKDGVTAKSYEFFRTLKTNEDDPETNKPKFELNSHQRFQLLKGRKQDNAPRVQMSYPDAERKDRHAGARGEIPVLLINTEEAKTDIDNMLDREMPGGGRIYFAKGMTDGFFNELLAETKTHKGWENLRKLPNEAFDLLSYAKAVCLYKTIGLEKIDWENPPAWAESWDLNSLVIDPAKSDAIEAKRSELYDLAQLAEQLA